MAFFSNWFKRKKPEEQEKKPGFFSRIFGRKEKTQEKKPGLFQRIFNRKKLDVIEEAKQEAEEAATLAQERIDQAIFDYEDLFPEDEEGIFTREEKEEREAEDAWEKEQDIRDREAEREKSRSTFNERYGTDWSEQDYRKFWDMFGDPIYNQTFGSTVLIYAAEDARSHNVPFDEFVRIVESVVNAAWGQGWNQQQAADELYTRLSSIYSLYE